MPTLKTPIATFAADVPPRTKLTIYPEPFASRMVGREKRQLGELFGLKNFGVNLTRLAPNAISALRHGLDVRRARTIVPERLAQIRYCLRQGILGDHDIRPE